MIYIFEDRKARQEKNEDIISSFNDIVSFAKFDVQDNENVEDYIYEKFADADCIIFHKSYTLYHNSLNVDKIKDMFIGNKIKFVIYSGGIEKGKVDHSGMLAYINADRMYHNLVYFLQRLKESKKESKESGDINLDVLVWGEQYRKNKILSLYYEIVTGKGLPVSFIEQPSDDIVSPEILEEIVDNVARKFKRAGFDIQNLLEPEMNCKEGTMSVAEIRATLECVVNKIIEG